MLCARHRQPVQHRFQSGAEPALALSQGHSATSEAFSCVSQAVRPGSAGPAVDDELRTLDAFALLIVTILAGTHVDNAISAVMTKVPADDRSGCS